LNIVVLLKNFVDGKTKKRRDSNDRDAQQIAPEFFQDRIVRTSFYVPLFRLLENRMFFDEPDNNLHQDRTNGNQ
jgi:hypothetical protein